MVKYSEVELKEFEIKLKEKKSKLQNQINDFRSQINELYEHGKPENSIDNSGYDMQVGFLMTQLSRANKHMADINNALLRIINKNYGICSVTGKKIDKNRLLAVLTTTKSMEGKLL